MKTWAKKSVLRVRFNELNSRFAASAVNLLFVFLISQMNWKFQLVSLIAKSNTIMEENFNVSRVIEGLSF